MDVAASVVLALLVCGATLLVLWLIRSPARRRPRSGEKNAVDRNPGPAREPVP
jgi:hypothetical protein